MIFRKSLALLSVICILLTSTPIYAYEEIPYMYKMKATAYCNFGKTCTETTTRIGIAATKKSWVGKTAVLYQRLPDGSVGELIGIYEIEDTGGSDGIKKGKVIDIWCPDLDSCQEFMNRVYEDGCKGNVYVDILNAEG